MQNEESRPRTFDKSASRLALVLSTLGLSQDGVARAVGVSPARISHYKRGRRRLPPEVAQAFQNRFGISAQWLLKGTGSPIHDRAKAKQFVRFEREFQIPGTQARADLAIWTEDGIRLLEVKCSRPPGVAGGDVVDASATCGEALSRTIAVPLLGAPVEGAATKSSAFAGSYVHIPDPGQANTYALEAVRFGPTFRMGEFFLVLPGKHSLVQQLDRQLVLARLGRQKAPSLCYCEVKDPKTVEVVLATGRKRRSMQLPFSKVHVMGVVLMRFCVGASEGMRNGRM